MLFALLFCSAGLCRETNHGAVWREWVGVGLCCCSGFREEGREKKRKDRRHKLAQQCQSFLDGGSSCFKVNGLLPDNTDFVTCREEVPCCVDDSCVTESLLTLPAPAEEPPPPLPPAAFRTVGTWTVVRTMGAVSNCLICTCQAGVADRQDRDVSRWAGLMLGPWGLVEGEGRPGDFPWTFSSIEPACSLYLIINWSSLQIVMLIHDGTS